MKRWLTLIPLALACAGLSGGTISADYTTNAYAVTSASTEYTLSVPTLNGTQLPKIRAVVVATPGVGGNRSFKVSDRWAEFLYENGLAYIGVGDYYIAPSSTLTALDQLASQSLGGITYGELANAPVLAYGESAGGSSAFNMAYDFPERTIAFVVEHTRFFSQLSDASDPEAVKKVPGYFRWGEWDNERLEQGYQTLAPASILPMIQSGAQWMCAFEHRQTHATRIYDVEEAMGYFGLILPLRYDYQEGVAGQDPALGAVTLTEIPASSGYLGEHRLGAVQTTPNASDKPYTNLLKDWDSRDPYYAPYNSFERSDLQNHSWMPNASIAAFWATKFSLGHHELSVDFIDLLEDDIGRDVASSTSSVFPNYFNTGQDIRIAVDASGFANTARVDFYANDVLMGSDDTAPYEFSYNFSEAQTGMHAIYPVAVTAEGQRCVGPRRMVQVYSSIRGANTAPTITPIGEATGTAGGTLSLPFIIGDAETDPDSLSLNFTYLNRTNSISSGDYNFSFAGSGANRTLEVQLPSTSGELWGIVQVSDGDLSTNAYVTIHVEAASNEAPFFVTNESATNAGPIYTLGNWSRPISVRVYDFDTPLDQLTLTATCNSPTNIPDENIHLGGSGQFRFIQVKPITGGGTITMTLSDGTHSVQQNFYVGPTSHANTPPVISDIPDQNASYSNAQAPIEVRVYDLQTPSEKVVDADTLLGLSVTSDNQSLIPNGSISVTRVGPRHRISFTPAYGQTGTATLTATVTDEGGLQAVDTFDVTVSAPPILAVTEAPVINATISEAYTAALSASGGIQPYTWSLSSGNLPNGVTLGSDGTLSGTPTETGTFAFTAQVQDSDPGGAATDTANFSLVVDPNLAAPGDLIATAETNTSITLSWSDTAIGETGYEIDRRVSGMLTWSTITTTAANATQFNDFGSLAAGTVYEYRLRAITATQQGDYTATTNAEAIAAPVITAHPQDVNVLRGNTANLTVTATGGALSYQWYEGYRGNTSAPVPGGTSPTLSVPNVTGGRTFWVRVSNAVSQADSLAALVGVDVAAPSLKVNLGAEAGANWNSYVSFTEFGGQTSFSDHDLIYDNGSQANGVSMTLSRTTTNEPFCDHFSGIPLATYPGTWLDDTAAGSAWGIGLGNYEIKFEVTGLPAGTYTIEVYTYITTTVSSSNDGTTYPPYKLDSNQMVAGLSGATTTTTTEFDSTKFDADAHGTELMRWENLSVGDGQTVTITSTGGSEYPVINAFIIKGISLDNLTPFETWATNNGVSANEVADNDNDGLSNLVEYALDLDPGSHAHEKPTSRVANDQGTDYLYFNFRRNLAASELTYRIMGSDDLINWVELSPEPSDYYVVEADPDGDGSAEVRELRVPTSGQSRQFLRLEIVQ